MKIQPLLQIIKIDKLFKINPGIISRIFLFKLFVFLKIYNLNIMKNICIAVFLLIGITTYSQQREERSSNEMATLMAKRISLQLDLNEKQQSEMKALYLKRIDERKQSSSKSGEERGERKNILEKYTEELKKILTQEQFQKFQGLQEKRRKGRMSPTRNNKKR